MRHTIGFILVTRLLFGDAGHAYITRTIYIDPINNNGPAEWNNVNFTSTNTTSLLTDSQMAQTSIRLSVVTALQGPNTAATTNPVEAATEFARAGANSAFGNTTAWGGKTIPFGHMALSNLSTNTMYHFTFYASRTGVTDNREALYSAFGANSGSNTLNASGNTSQVAVVSNIWPRTDGTIDLRMECGPNNTEANRFYYLGAMKITYEEEPRVTIFVDAASTNGAASGWNHVGFNMLTNSPLYDTTGMETPIQMHITKALNSGLNYNAALSTSRDAAEFAPAGIDNAYGLAGSSSYGTALLSGLSPATAYSFYFYASRMGVTDNREALYTVTGANSSSNTLNASTNSTMVARIENIYPKSDGTLTLRIEKGPGNNNSSGYFYVSSIKITYATNDIPTLHEKPKRLLFFGNSFSLVDDVPGHVASLATLAGHPTPLVVADLLGGQDLAYHISQIDSYPENNVAHATLTGTNTWDHVIIQGYSTEATHLRDPLIFTTNAVALLQRIRNHASGKGTGAGAVLYQTWARAPGHSFYPTSFTTPAAMQAEIRTNYQAAATMITGTEPNADLRIALVGDAFERGNFALDFYGADLYHAGNLGPRMAAMILYKTIYNATVTNIPYAAAIAAGWTTMSSNDWVRVTYLAEGLTPPDMPAPIPPTPPGLGTREVILIAAANSSTSALSGWNAVPFTSLSASPLVLTNGYETDAMCTVLTRMNSVNTYGSPTPSGEAAIFAPAGANSAYGNVNPFSNSYSNYYARARFSNLNPNRSYAFTLYASRMNATDNRETLYTLTGANTGSATLDAANNSTQVAIVTDIFPRPDGTIDLQIEPGPNNTNAYLFYHLTAIKIESVRRGFLILIP